MPETILRYTDRNELVKEVSHMSAAEIERSIRTAASSLEMEGLYVDEQCVAWCRQMLSGQITIEEYMKLITTRVGV